MGACSRTLQWEHALLLDRCESPFESEQSEQAIPSSHCVQFHYLDLQYNICGQRHWHPIPQWWTWWSRCPKPKFFRWNLESCYHFFRNLRCERSGHWAMTLVDQLIIELWGKDNFITEAWSLQLLKQMSGKHSTKRYKVTISDTNCTTSVWSTLTQSSISCEIENVWKEFLQRQNFEHSPKSFQVWSFLRLQWPFCRWNHVPWLLF